MSSKSRNSKSKSKSKRPSRAKDALASLSRQARSEADQSNFYRQYDEDTNELVDASKSHAQEVAELRKRQEVVRKIREVDNPMSVTRPKFEVPLDQVLDEEQNCFVVHVVHEGLRPRSTKPGIRIMGAFANTEEATDHYNRILAKPFADWDHHMFQRAEKYALMRDYERLDPSIMQAKVAKIERMYDLRGKNDALRRHIEWKKRALRNRIETEGEEETPEEAEKKERERLEKSAYRAEKKATDAANGKSKLGSTRKLAVEQHIKSECADPKAPGGLHKSDGRVPNACRIPGQNVAVISILKDITPEAVAGDAAFEPVVILWRAFNRKEEAQNWIEQQGKNAILDHHMFVVDMYALLTPQNVELDKIQSKYRHGQQDEVMQGVGKGHRNVKDYEDFCKGQGIEAPTTEICVDEETSALSMVHKNATKMTGTIKASEKALSKDLPTDQAKLRTDPKYVSKAEAKARMDQLNKDWESVPSIEHKTTDMGRGYLDSDRGIVIHEGQESKAEETEKQRQAKLAEERAQLAKIQEALDQNPEPLQRLDEMVDDVAAITYQPTFRARKNRNKKK